MNLETKRLAPEPEVAPRSVARRVPQCDARIEPAFEPAPVLRTEAQQGSRFRDEARQLRERAESELSIARASAESIVIEAKREAERIVLEAKNRAAEHQRAGFDEGRAIARERIEELLRLVGDEERRRFEAFPALVRDAAFRFAKAILDVEFVARPELIRELLEAALDRADGKEVAVELSEADFGRIGAEVAEIATRTGARLVRARPVSDLGERQVRIVADNGGRWTVGIDSALSDLRTYVERATHRNTERQS